MTRTAAKVAAMLKSSGIPVLAATEGDDEVDGMVDITPIISVQISTDDDVTIVVIEHPAEDEEETEYEFWSPRTDAAGLVADVQRALSMYGRTQ